MGMKLRKRTRIMYLLRAEKYINAAVRSLHAAAATGETGGTIPLWIHDLAINLSCDLAPLIEHQRRIDRFHRVLDATPLPEVD